MIYVLIYLLLGAVIGVFGATVGKLDTPDFTDYCIASIIFWPLVLVHEIARKIR